MISLRAIINFDPSEARLKASALTLKLLLRLVDKISVLRFTPTIRTKLMKNRQNMEKQKQKEKLEGQEEEILAKKREKDDKYKEKLKTLPPDQ